MGAAFLTSNQDEEREQSREPPMPEHFFLHEREQPMVFRASEARFQFIRLTSSQLHSRVGQVALLACQVSTCRQVWDKEIGQRATQSGNEVIAGRGGANSAAEAVAPRSDVTVAVAVPVRCARLVPG